CRFTRLPEQYSKGASRISFAHTRRPEMELGTMSSSPSSQSPTPRTGAADLLLGLKSSGIDYLFANAGTDFPPIIEAFASLPADQVPTPVVVPHETASVAMAHGYYLVTGRP